MGKVELGHEIFIANCLVFVPLVILFYEYVATFEREVRLYWPPRHPLGWVSSVFLANRYLSLLGHIPILYSVFGNMSYKFCSNLFVYHSYYEIVLQLFVGALCMMRIYALYNKSRWILAFLIGISVLSVAVAVWSIVRSSGGGPHIIATEPLFVGCNQLMPDDNARHLAIAWSGVLVFDSAVFGLTAYRTLRIGKGRLAMILLRDGALYFVVLFCTNLGNILTLLLASEVLRTGSTTMTNVISDSLITRIMLNIREVMPPGRSTRPTTDEPFSYDTPVDTGAAPLSTIVDGMPTTSFYPTRRSQPWVDTTAEYPYDTENGIEMRWRSEADPTAPGALRGYAVCECAHMVLWFCILRRPRLWLCVARQSDREVVVAGRKPTASLTAYMMISEWS
ncbi:unnamed protein product [Peniophora sp. CBMAI 1063]|nr:unnamed protein product [Peniophora sp. CBMAI 1063]